MVRDLNDPHVSADSVNTNHNILYTVKGPNKPSKLQLEKCMDSLRPLLEKASGEYCQWIHDGQCSIGGQYQPSLPTGGHFKFIGTSSYKYAWSFQMMPHTATLSAFKKRAAEICSMSFEDVTAYAERNNLYIDQSNHMTEFLPYFCFMASYNLILLMGM